MGLPRESNLRARRCKSAPLGGGGGSRRPKRGTSALMEPSPMVMPLSSHRPAWASFAANGPAAMEPAGKAWSPLSARESRSNPSDCEDPQFPCHRLHNIHRMPPLEEVDIHEKRADGHDKKGQDASALGWFPSSIEARPAVSVEPPLPRKTPFLSGTGVLSGPPFGIDPSTSKSLLYIHFLRHRQKS